MRQRILLTMAVQSIMKNKMRTLLTMLGIVIGVGAVIVMVAIGNGAKTQIQAQINSLGTNLLVITAGAVQGAVSQGAGTFNRLTVADAEAIKREATTLTAVSPVIVTRTQAIGGVGNWRTEVDGVTTDYPSIRNWNVASGSWFDESDVEVKKAVAVLGNTVAKNLFPDSDPVGAKIQLGHTPFTILGVLATKGQNSNGSDQDDVILIPYTAAQARLSGFAFVGQILASTESPDDLEAGKSEIAEILRESHRLTNGAPDDFTIRDQTQIAATASSTTKVMTALLAAMASVSLVVGGIGIMNIMLVSVTERTREIGIRMAVGARGSDVLTQFLVESVVMSILGGLVGLGVGVGGATLLGRLTGWATSTPVSAVFLALGFSGAVGIFFGFYPAKKAAALNPIQALRYE